ncbi:transcriptional regulator [Paenibacillus albiflavus]|uniref:Transcriptional regulator n=1 Tax=Paenibacillus albiflavus TaxID=2545760 RepID=A0A4R4EGB0_9BACL|nr:helix-turn-helix domain-containing protein [Paenibacillus albiflavus]TCZ78180.1 transcriptional regulator [Paenibacillus albiflavus]
MKRSDNKSHCPINFSLETFGDSWSLLIIRDMVYFGKKTYGEFLESDEGISSNILASRLVHLEQRGLIVKKPHDTDKRKEVYLLTEKGLDLIPILLELADWAAKYDSETDAPQSWIAAVNSDRKSMISLIRDTVKDGGSVFSGSNSVVSKLTMT